MNAAESELWAQVCESRLVLFLGYPASLCFSSHNSRSNSTNSHGSKKAGNLLLQILVGRVRIHCGCTTSTPPADKIALQCLCCCKRGSRGPHPLGRAPGVPAVRRTDTTTSTPPADKIAFNVSVVASEVPEGPALRPPRRSPRHVRRTDTTTSTPPADKIALSMFCRRATTCSATPAWTSPWVLRTPPP